MSRSTRSATSARNCIGVVGASMELFLSLAHQRCIDIATRSMLTATRMCVEEVDCKPIGTIPELSF